ncbi:molybdate ABC transporter substrate-binding protein [Roseovarius sp. CAU 1744]|uniref:molybdate ABC transporter substrate-binding protein n=1 Tax=Roseovarius sp. CAU 1744 TaxID=3140368 RepID=UPI00325BAC39
MYALFRQIAMICALILVPAAGVSGQTVTVFAAASLRDALDDMAQAYPGNLVVSYGGSGQIARQVAQGAPADIVLLANVAWMDWLEDQGLIEADSRSNLLENRLVLAGPEGAARLETVSAQGLLDRLSGGRLAIGQTQSVPAGIYGRQWLENAGLWPALAPHLAETENVRAALALIARGETPLGVVYATDARADPGVVTLYEVPGKMHDPIYYTVAETKRRNDAQASEFIEFIRSNDASMIFAGHGFLPVDQAQ